MVVLFEERTRRVTVKANHERPCSNRILYIIIRLKQIYIEMITLQKLISRYTGRTAQRIKVRGIYYLARTLNTKCIVGGKVDVIVEWLAVYNISNL